MKITGITLLQISDVVYYPELSIHETFNRLQKANNFPTFLNTVSNECILTKTDLQVLQMEFPMPLTDSFVYTFALQK